MLIAVGPLPWALAADLKDGSGPDYLEYTPEDFIESLMMEPEVPAARDSEPEPHDLYLQTFTPRRLFVGDEPLEVRYVIHVPLNVSVREADYGGEIRPFDLLALNMGKRMPAPGMSRYERQTMVLSVRLPADKPYGIYILPALRISYQYSEASGDELRKVEGEVLSKPIELRKVPLFVEVAEGHDKVTIGEPFMFSLEIHADSMVEVLNEHPPDNDRKDPEYLSEYMPPEPFASLGSSREEAASGHYRVIRWAFTVAAHGLDNEPLSLELPRVIWRQAGGHGEPEGQVTGKGEVTALRTTQPEPLKIKVLAITVEGDSFRGMKGLHARPERERLWLLTLPRAVLWVLSLAAAILALWQAVVFMRALRRGPELPAGEEATEGVKWAYDWGPLLRLLLRYRLPRAIDAFQSSPGNERCAELRGLLARGAAVRCRQRRIPVQEASAMTASELRALVGEAPETGIISELDRQLETGKFIRLTDPERVKKDVI
jgi:hypothetical protein